MGEVYRARDRKLGRDVALKVLPEEFGRDAARVSRFEREARLLASVNHPGIAAIYGAEEAGETRYLVLELVAGETLSDRMRRALSFADTLRIMRQIAEALEAAHERGIIHRDLKPANVMVTPEGRVKLLDLGLAKLMASPRTDGDGFSRELTAPLEDTRPGVIMGTVEFMSPEQARGKAIDKRTDIWAFGCASRNGRRFRRTRRRRFASSSSDASRRTPPSACATSATRGWRSRRFWPEWILDVRR
jgi:serine/threonine-protein kinase